MDIARIITDETEQCRKTLHTALDYFEQVVLTEKVEKVHLKQLILAKKALRNIDDLLTKFNEDKETVYSNDGVLETDINEEVIKKQLNNFTRAIKEGKDFQNSPELLEKIVAKTKDS